jgi:hypothetical protein
VRSRRNAEVTIGPREKGVVPGWFCDAQVGRTKYRVGVLAISTDTSRPDPWGVVSNAKGRVIWRDRVVGSISARELRRRAHLLD